MFVPEQNKFSLMPRFSSHPRFALRNFLDFTSATHNTSTLHPPPFYPHTLTLSPSTIMAEQLVLRGTLEGHSGWVTSLATSLEK